ncbi:MAG TPA: hypothetical protein VM658_02375 [bacterium]|nr:hypothetical protein [bacterium]
MTPAAQQALANLRQTDQMQWYVIPLLALVFYIYLNEIEKRNWSAVWLGIGTWAGEMIWEMFNGAILHFTQFAPLWSTPGPTAFEIYAGLNLEITLFFSLAGLLLVKVLPRDPTLKILGLPNRILIPIGGGLLALFVEIILNQCGLLVWDWWFWRWPHVYLIAIAYCAPALGLAWLHDHSSLRAKRRGAFILLALALACHLILATMLGWV